MPRKTYSKTGRYCRLTFKLPVDESIQTVALCGEFNDWDPKSHPMARRKDGSFSLTLSLPAGKQYRYRYLLNGDRWENDPAADGYMQNLYGSDDSLINV
jgi:1,4-alpha-glucan branching enzyme